MSNKYARVWNAFQNEVWALRQEKLAQIVTFLEFACAGGKYSMDQVEERIAPAAAASRRASAPANIAVIPVRGIISPRMSMMGDISGPGGTSTEGIARDLRAALADETVSAIVLDVDSPGGSVYGVDEVSKEIFAARGKKPILASVNALAASAAYWIATAADSVDITPSGEAGSVGVYAMHVDMSKAVEAEGMAVTFISAGDHKTEGNPYQPLADDAKAYIQSRIDDYYGMFTKALARNRGISPEAVRKNFGGGRVLGASDALAAGMVDRIATFDETLARAARAGRSSANKSALAFEREHMALA